MDYVKPSQIVNQMIDSGTAKANLPPVQLLLRGGLAGAILACATTLAFTATAQTNLGIVGAAVFPVGFVIIVLLGLELVTGSFALIPPAVLKRKTTPGKMLSSFGWVIGGHVLGCIIYAALYGLTVTKMGTDMGGPLAQTLVQTAEAKTLAYKEMGASGMALVLIKAVLCNWMVTLGAVMALASNSTIGKIAAMWLPIFIFFGQGFEHAVVNLFVIPAGMMLGANVGFGDWLIWNQIPVFVGNFAGGALCTGLMYYWSQTAASAAPPAGGAARARSEAAGAEKSA